MFRIIFIIIFFTKLLFSSAFAENTYEIILKIDKKIVTNFDIQKETRYLVALNPSLKNLSKKQIKKI